MAENILTAVGVSAGAPVVIFGLPDAAIEEIRKGEIRTFDLRELGIGLEVSIVLFSAPTKADCVRELEEGMMGAGGEIVRGSKHDLADMLRRHGN